MIPLTTTLQHCNYTSEKQYKEDYQNLGLGLAYLCQGIAYTICYVPCMIVMLRKELWSNICYKLMFFDGIYDLGTLLANSILPGIIMIAPYDYNCYPAINQYIMDIWARESP
uniref:Uncharacterized protein n=1 Tax=Plectus sambesii TaxID=2011161 RepID=A0A914XEZ4_9BILA